MSDDVATVNVKSTITHHGPVQMQQFLSIVRHEKNHHDGMRNLTHGGQYNFHALMTEVLRGLEVDTQKLYEERFGKLEVHP